MEFTVIQGDIAAQEAERDSPVNPLIRAFATQVRAASDVLAPSTGEGDDGDDDEEGREDDEDAEEDDEEDDNEDAETRPTTLSKRQLAIFAQDLREIASLALAATRAQR